MKKYLKIIFALAVLVAWVFAAVGGTLYLCYDGHAIFGIANIAVVAMAAPYVYDTCLKNLGL